LVAQALALDHPSLVSALGLFGTASRIGSGPAWSERIERVRREGIAAIAPAVVERWFGPELRQRQPETVRGYQLLLERTPIEGYLATLGALETADLTQRVSGIRCPTLVVSGGRDAATPAEQGRALAAAIPSARFELLPEAAHLMSVDQPDALVQRLLTFLSEHSLV
jgi:3-oxoadipate enol-lactonase